MAHRKTSPQTRVKLSQAAKRRHRGLKGTALGGKFLAGAAFSFKSSPKKAKPTPKGERFERTPDPVRKAARETFPQELQTFEGEFPTHRPATRAGQKRQAARVTRMRVMQEQKISDPADAPTTYDMMGGPMSVRHADLIEVNKRLRETRWNDPARGRDLYKMPPGGHDLRSAPGGGTQKGYKPPSKFIKEELPKAHADELDRLLADPSSPFNEGLTTSFETQGKTKTPGARNRLERYTRALQEGQSHADALDYIKSAHQGPQSREQIDQMTLGRMQSRLKPAIDARETGRRGSKSPYENLAPKPDEFKFGIEAQAPRSLERIKEQFPNLNDQDAIRVQEADKESIRSELLRNAAWASETRRSELVGEAQRKRGQASDRVTIFTTSLGGPAVSVGTDSLVGQYIIRKRRQYFKQTGLATKASLRGEFPSALLDQHLVELRMVGGGFLQGRAGLDRDVGVRVKGKKTPGFGNNRPWGAGVVTNSDGSPALDSKGNIRYSEGHSTKFELGSKRKRGFRVFAG